MAVVRWLGPPENSVGLIGFGLVTPGDVITLDDDFADKLIKEGRAEVVSTEATPAAEALADQLGIDIITVSGTGTEGKVTKADVVAVNKETF
jgi:hypothetical protein